IISSIAYLVCFFLCFFFQAEDGIRDRNVTGVQTCALPIWMASLVEKPLFGDLVATDPVNAIRYHLTSGTTGRTPIRVLDSTKDWDWISEMWCYGLWAFGVRPEDVVYVAFGYGSFIGFWGLHYACEKMGALVMPGGAQTTEGRS